MPRAKTAPDQSGWATIRHNPFARTLSAKSPPPSVVFRWGRPGGGFARGEDRSDQGKPHPNPPQRKTAVGEGAMHQMNQGCAPAPGCFLINGGQGQLDICPLSRAISFKTDRKRRRSLPQARAAQRQRMAALPVNGILARKAQPQAEGSDKAQRKPMLLFLFVGSFLLRFDARTLFPLLFHDPPRSAARRPYITGDIRPQMPIPGAARKRILLNRKRSGPGPVYHSTAVFSQPPNKRPISVSIPDT